MAIEVCQSETQAYLKAKGYEDVFTTVTSLHWMGAWPTDRAQSFGLLVYGGFAAAAGGAVSVTTKSVAEAMGIPTLRYKQCGWALAAFFMGCIGAVFGNMVGYIEPIEVAFPAPTFGIFMVAMALLGGKGTLWGPVLGAVLFHVVKETTWTYLLGWQWVALGLILIINIVYFQQGIMGWLQTRYPERFGITVDPSSTAAKEEA